MKMLTYLRKWMEGRKFCSVLPIDAKCNVFYMYSRPLLMGGIMIGIAAV